MKRKTTLLLDKSSQMSTKQAELAILMFALISISGCGSIMHGSMQDVMIYAPNDAHVIVDNEPTQQKGPMSVNLSRKNEHFVYAEAPGKSISCDKISSSLSGGVLIADILLFPIGVIVDWTSGAWNNLEPSSVNCRVAAKPSQVNTVITPQPAINSSQMSADSKQSDKTPGLKDDAARLEKLKKMKERGLISPQEYENKKKEILDAM